MVVRLLKPRKSIFNKPNVSKYATKTWVVTMLFALNWSGTTSVNFTLDKTIPAAWVAACLGAPIIMFAESNNSL